MPQTKYDILVRDPFQCIPRLQNIASSPAELLELLPQNVAADLTNIDKEIPVAVTKEGNSYFVFKNWR